MKKFLPLHKFIQMKYLEEEINSLSKMQSTQHGVYHFKIILLSTPITLCTKSDLWISIVYYLDIKDPILVRLFYWKAHVHLSLNTEWLRNPTSVLSKMYFIYSWSRYALTNKQESASWKLDSSEIFYLEKSFSTEIEVLEFHSGRLWLQKTHL